MGGADSDDAIEVGEVVVGEEEVAGVEVGFEVSVVDGYADAV